MIEFISTGHEVLTGEIVDTNSSWMAERLSQEGLSLRAMYTVGDDLEDLVDLFQDRSQSKGFVVVNGGLGPTSDDLSAQAAAKAAGVDLVLEEAWVQQLKRKYQGRPMPSSNLKQAWLPAGATWIDNPRGTACGFHMMIGKRRFFFTPGVPSEMKAMVEASILPTLSAAINPGQPKVMKRVFTFGLSEARVGEYVNRFATDGLDVGFRASFPLIQIKLRGDETIIDKQLPDIRNELGDYIFCEDRGDAAAMIQDLMTERGHTLAMAESCTGGLVASTLVSRAGSSAYFLASSVVYSDQMKCDLLGVRAETLRDFGAVSEEVAAEMALGILERAGSDVSLAVSGVAGPGGGSEEKPVGTVAFALSFRDDSGPVVRRQVLRFPPWDRGRIRHASAMVCLDMLRRHLQSKTIVPHYDYAQRVSHN